MYEVDIDDIGPALRYATAKIQKTTRSGTSDGGQSASAALRWGRSWGPGRRQSGGDSWGGAVDEPPF